MITHAPVVAGRDRARILAALLARLPGYTPEWAPPPGTAGDALLSVFARLIELQGQALDRMPARLRLAFLDALGNGLLPAQSARAPLVFTLMSNAPLDVTLPARSQIAAKLPPPPPPLAGAPAPPAPAAPLFFVEQTIMLTRGRLAAVYSVDPDADTYHDHSAETAAGFTLFSRMAPVPHGLYLGHGALFKLSGTAEIVLSFNLASPRGAGTSRPLLIDWEYLSENGWLPLEIVEDETARLTRDGRITLQKTCGPDSKEDTLESRTSYWIHGQVSARTPAARIGPLPGGWQIVVSATSMLAALPPVTVDGAQTANILSVAGRDVTIDQPLPLAAPHAILRHAATNAFVAEIAMVRDPLHLVVVGVDAGRIVTIDGTSTACVLDAEGATSVLAQPLVGPSVAPGAQILDAGTGHALGTLDAVRPHFRVPVEDGSDFLAGDALTVDGTTRAVVSAATRTIVMLDGPVEGADVGARLVLAEALPPLRHDGADQAGVLPEIDVVRARVGVSKSGLVPDAAFTDMLPVDMRAVFRPFGPQPTRFTTFYVACREAFQRGGARVALVFSPAQAGTGYSDTGEEGVGAAKLDWSVDYYDGREWHPLGDLDELRDDTKRLTAGGPGDPRQVSFLCPRDWEEVAVNGIANLWLRVQITSGNYGHPLQLSVETVNGQTTVSADPETLAPPVVASLTVQYTYYTNSELIQHCLAYNDFAFTDCSERAQWPGSPFSPFAPVADRTAALHLGFTHKLPVGLVSLFAASTGTEEDDEATPSPFLWEYLSARGWVELAVVDQTRGLSRTGVVQFIGPADAVRGDGLGGSLYRVRARLKPGVRVAPQRVAGLWLNGLWARQGESVQHDTIGVADGTTGQTFVFAPQRVPVMPGEVIELREWNGRGDDWETALLGVPLEDVRFEVDPRDGTTKTAAWVRWHGRPHLLSSGPDDRHYALERAAGLLQFGGPPFGMAPPAGARIGASYTSGGGLAGNVPAGTISELRSGVGYVQTVTNPLPAAGGTATETGESGRDRATERLAHRDRAVAAGDYEWIARDASPEVARVRCLPVEGPPGAPLRGWVTLVIVPQATTAAPQPTPELAERVLAHLRARVPAGVASRVRVVPPTYVSIGVHAEIVLCDLDDVGRVESQIRGELSRFLHPLTGGRDGRGHRFGDALYLSEVAALLEAVDGVDFIRRLQIEADGALQDDVAVLPPHALPTEGDHALKLVAREA